MSRWFRHYAGMMRDEKLVAVAIRSKQPVERVVWVWGAILESAAEVDDAGRFEIDAAEVAYFLRADEADIQSVLDALANAGRLAADRVVKWGDRQYQSDKSAERQSRYRARRRSEHDQSDDQRVTSDLTLPSRDGEVTPQETDTELETETENNPPAPVLLAPGARDLFDEIWGVFPENPSSVEAKAKRLFDALSKAEQSALLVAAKRYRAWFAADCVARKRTEQAGLRFVPHLSTWIETGAWREAKSLLLVDEKSAPVVAMIRLDRERDHALWAECERIQGKPAPTSGVEWSFLADLVDKARSSVGKVAA